MPPAAAVCKLKHPLTGDTWVGLLIKVLLHFALLTVDKQKVFYFVIF